MSHMLHHAGGRFTFSERLAVTVAAVFVILTAWGSAVVLFAFATLALAFLWIAESIHNHRLLLLIAFLVAAIIALRSVS